MSSDDNAARGTAPGDGAWPCHPGAVVLSGLDDRWTRCAVCGTERRVAAVEPAYGDDYAAARAHHDPDVGAAKAATLHRWLRAVGVDARGESACEIGFGGGWCLAALQGVGARVAGLEPIAANREHAARLGIPRERLFDVAPEPRLPEPVALWLLLDSFEHVPDPAALIGFMARASAPRSRVLLVAPDAGSLSRRLLGRLWLHDTPDHPVHYTVRGVVDLFAREGFELCARFRPTKRVSLKTAFAHAALLATGRRGERADLPRALGRAGVWFNIGEMGLLLERQR